MFLLTIVVSILLIVGVPEATFFNMLGSLGPFGTPFGAKVSFGTTLGALWEGFGVELGSLWGYFWRAFSMMFLCSFCDHILLLIFMIVP